MRAGDLPTVVTWHLAHFPDSFYAQLGERFMGTYYRAYLNSPHAFARVIEDQQGHLLGYLIGSLNDSAHRRRTARRHGLRQVATGAFCLVTRPWLWVPFLRVRAIWYARRSVSGIRRQFRQGSSGKTFGELAYVITHERSRNTGVGSQLTESYLAAARRAGAQWALLVTPAEQHIARRFYESRGWISEGHRTTRDGAPLAAYRLPLSIAPGV